MDIAAGIVLYNPNIDRLKQLLAIITRMVDKVFLYNNSSDSFDFILESYKDKLVYLSEGKNLGIAYALNKIMEKAQMYNYDWVITLDQDTLIPETLVDSFRPFLNEKDVAIVCPQVIDKRREYMQLNSAENEVSEINDCITSASCTNVRIWKKIGGFDEWLFIDFVDNDFCKRAILSGFRILRVNGVVIDQEFGIIEPKSPKAVKFWIGLSKVSKIHNIAKLSYRKKVSPMRVYYVHRNLLYLNKKFKDFGGIGYHNFNCSSFIGFLFFFSLPSIVRAQEKWKVFKAVVKGFSDGHKSSAIVFKI